VKAIDKRRLTSQSDRAMAVREITMHRFIHQFSPASCLPIIRDIFADGEAAETAEDDDCKSIASCCSGSTKSVSSHSAYDDSHHNNHWHIVQDFEAGGGNLELYLLDRENLIFEMTENGGSNSEGNQNKNNNFRALSDASRATSNIMQESEVRSLARALVQALYQLHRRSICHNDLCPENILIPVSPTTRHRDNEPDPNNSENEEFRSYSYLHNRHRRRQSHDASSGDFFEDLKLCDLGRAFVVDESAANATTDGDPTDCNIPRHSSIYFTSPEVLLGKHPGLASDMWSVGVILYRCFAGELPFRERSDDGTSIPHSTVSGYASSSSTSMDSKLRQQLKRDICRAHCNFGRSSRNKIIDLRWSRVTRGAKQFLSALLNPVPSVRLTCEEAFHHPWLMNSATGMGAVWGMSESSFSPPLTMTPIVPSKTLTNHYHHHPRYSTTRTIEMNQGNHFHSQHERTADVEPTSFRTLPSSALYVSESRPSDELNSSPGRRPKSFVHKLLGRLKSSSGNNKSHHRSKTL
jgi:serine/threonine protein kinase